MCILLIAVNSHPHHPLILAANRDEEHARASALMHWWDDADILAGRDARAGGTWFGVNADGRVAAVTNQRTGFDDDGDDDGNGNSDSDRHRDKQSRGELVARFLRGDDSLDGYAQFLRGAYHHFNPFNLLYGTPAQLFLFGSSSPSARALGDGVHGVGNGALDDAPPKVSRGVSLLRSQIAACDKHDGAPDDFAAQLVTVMQDQTADGDDDGDEPIFITGKPYGTRATTLLFGGARLNVYEYNYRESGAEFARRRYTINAATT